jgi:NADH-quinone oxidoreductase subunit J
MPAALFYFFAAVMIIGGISVVALRNPVSSAMAMVASFVGLAALFVGLNAYFVGIIQILVYAGAIMVLFIFIIMLLDLKTEANLKLKALPAIGCLFIVIIFTIQLVGVLSNTPNKMLAPLDFPAIAAAPGFAEAHPAGSAIHRAVTATEPSLPDVHLIGHTLFNGYNLPLQIVGVLLLVATVGVVALSRRQTE